MNPVVVATFRHIVDIIGNEYKEQQKISDKSLSMLSFLFDFTAVQALDLIDKRCISHITSPSGRELYKIQKNVSEVHICLKDVNYCTCPSFMFHVVKKNQFMCKHLLATILCSAMGLCKEIQYSDETLTLMLIGEA